MPYRIDYRTRKYETENTRWLVRMLLSSIIFIVFLVLTTVLWPEGSEVLQLLLIPGDPHLTMESAETFISELHCGNNIIDAASDFFDIIAYNESLY